MIDGVPTAVYRPVKAKLPVSRLIRNDVILSARWLHETRKFPVGSMLKLYDKRDLYACKDRRTQRHAEHQ